MPRKPMYFLGLRRPTSSICCSMPVTMISRKFCQRERFRSMDSLRVTSFEPTVSTSISPHVNDNGGVEFEKPMLPEDQSDRD